MSRPGKKDGSKGCEKSTYEKYERKLERKQKKGSPTLQKHIGEK